MKKLALSTAVVALLSGAAFAQTTAPSTTEPPASTPSAPAPSAPESSTTPPASSNPTTPSGHDQHPMTGSEASPSAPRDEVNTGVVGGEPAINSMDDEAGEETAGSATEAPEGFEPVMMEQLNAEMLMDATIYDAEDTSVGDISEVMPETGMPETVIVDVGGFLGIGQKPVSLMLSELTFYKQTDGEEVRGYTTMTNDQLTDLPEYEG